MSSMEPSAKQLKLDDKPDSQRIVRSAGLPPLAYLKSAGTKSPGVMYVGGFMSTKSGSKQEAIRAHVTALGHSFISYDYTDLGDSTNETHKPLWSLAQWLDDTLTVLDTQTTGPQILVGSSMGAWLSLVTALRRPDRVAAIVTISAAVGFTEKLKKLITPEQMNTYESGAMIEVSRPGLTPCPINKRFIEDGHALYEELGADTDEPIDVKCPIRFVHSLADDVAPYECSVTMLKRVVCGNARLHLTKEGEHRMQQPNDLQLIMNNLDEMLKLVA